MTATRSSPTVIRSASVALAALVAALALTPDSADAGQRRSRCWENDRGRVVCRDRASSSYSRDTAASREYDRIRADQYDPTGSYSAYPDWARYALSPKGMR